MKGTTATIYAKRDDTFDEVSIYKTNPAKKKYTTEEQAVWNGGNYVFKNVRVLATPDSEYSFYLSTMTDLLGRKLAKNRTYKISISTKPRAQGRELYASRINRLGSIRLYDEKPTITTETLTQQKLQLNADGTYVRDAAGGYKYVDTTVKNKVLRNSAGETPSAIDEFCYSGFRRGTGITVPKGKVTTLKVRVTPVTK